MSNRVDTGRPEMVMGIGLAEPELMGQNEHLAVFSFMIKVEKRSIVKFFRHWWVHLLQVMRLKIFL